MKELDAWSITKQENQEWELQEEEKQQMEKAK